MDLPLGEMLEHQNQIEANVPKFSGTVLAEFQERIHLNPLVTTFRGCAFVVHGLPLIASPRRRSIETDVGFHRNGTGSAELGIGTGMFTGADSAIIQRAAEFGIQTVQIVAVRLHFKAIGTKRHAVRANRNAMVIGSLAGIPEVEVNEWHDIFFLAELVHGHGIMSRIQKQ